MSSEELRRLLLDIFERIDNDIWDFNKHSSTQMNSFNDISVDIHVIRKKSSSLFFFVDGVLGDSLTNEFLEFTSSNNVSQRVNTLLDKAKAESAKTELNKSSVIDDLDGRVKIYGNIRDVRHQEVLLSEVVSSIDAKKR